MTWTLTGTDGPTKTFMAYNPRGDPVTVQFKDAAGAATGDPKTVAPNELGV